MTLRTGPNGGWQRSLAVEDVGALRCSTSAKEVQVLRKPLPRPARAPLRFAIGQLRHGRDHPLFQTLKLLVDLLAEAEISLELDADAYGCPFGGGLIGRHDATSQFSVPADTTIIGGGGRRLLEITGRSRSRALCAKLEA